MSTLVDALIKAKKEGWLEAGVYGNIKLVKVYDINKAIELAKVSTKKNADRIDFEVEGPFIMAGKVIFMGRGYPEIKQQELKMDAMEDFLTEGNGYHSQGKGW